VESIGCIGYGEVGATLAGAFDDLGYDVVVTNRSPADLRAELEGASVEVADSPGEVASHCDLVISCVWPETAAAVARDAGSGVGAITWFLDLNAISPGTTAELERSITAAGGTFQKGSIFGSVGRRGTAGEVVLAGADLPPVAAALREVGFEVEEFGEDPRRSAALKMHTSLITKGVRELFVEALISARYYGLEQETLDVASAAFERRTFSTWIPTALVNTPTYARRRMGELGAVVETVEEAGLESPIAVETLRLHEYVAGRGLDGDDYLALLDGLTERYRP